MQTVLTYLTLLLSGFLIQAQSTIEVEITGFDSNDGIVMVGLYNEEGKFLNTHHMATSSEINDQKAKVSFTDVPDGVYAISCFHDKDNNGKLNFFLGMYPTEATGTSNNAPSKFGPPKWEDAKFEVKDGENLSFTINL